MRRSRLANEIQLWRMSWQQVETFLDRVEGARDDDHPYAVRCGALFDAAIVIERLRLRRHGAWMPHPLRMNRRGASATIETEHDDRKYDLPGPLEVEMAVAGLIADDDGKPKKSPPRVRLFGSEELFEVWDPDDKQFVAIVAPEYVFGRLFYPTPNTPHPWIPGLRVQPRADVAIGASASSDDSLFSFPRREAAAEEGFAVLKSWNELRLGRKQAAELDFVEEELVEDQLAFGELRSMVTSGNDTEARAVLDEAARLAGADAASLRDARAALADEDPDDEALPALGTMSDTIARERGLLAEARAKISGSVSASERSAALALIDELPTPASMPVAITTVYDDLDAAIDERCAYPDGPLRSLRLLEVSMVKMWRSKAPWFARRHRVLARLMSRYLTRFERNLTSLVEDGRTQLDDALDGVEVATATAAGAEHLPVTGSATALARVRPGAIAVLGGARPALAVILGAAPPSPSGPRLRITPLRVSQKSGIGLDGIPGLVREHTRLGSTLARPLTGDELRRGARAGEPEADAIPREVVALWSRLRLLRGHDVPLRLPPPFESDLALPVHVTGEAPLAAHAPRLILPTAPIDAASDPLVATPGEVLLLRGRDADGAWWQGAVEVALATVTTLEAEGVEPERDPASPICCEPETPVVLVALAMNTVPVDLASQVTVHRDFRGFGWPSLAIAKLVPGAIDSRTEAIAARPHGRGYRFVVGGTGDLVDRTPELEAAAFTLDRWIGGP